MSNATRWVIVDDTNPDINYLGGTGGTWFADVQDSNEIRPDGVPFLGTVHGTNGSASLTLNFTGTSVIVVGSNNQNSSGNVKNPQWSCLVDDNHIDAGIFQPGFSNNFALCQAYSLNDGPHSLKLNTTVTHDQTFWFDRVLYLPSPHVTLEQQILLVQRNDPGITQNRTPLADSHAIFHVTFPFVGVSVSWYGTINSTFNPKFNNLSWSIDNEEPNYTWTWSQPVNATLPLQSQKFFQSPEYPFGSHVLHVDFSISNAQSPELGLNFFIVQGGTWPPNGTYFVPDKTSNGPGISTTTRAVPISSESDPHRVSRIMIIAAVAIGVLFVFATATLVIFLCYRRLNVRKRNKSEELTPFQLPNIEIPASPRHSAWRKSPLPIQAVARVELDQLRQILSSEQSSILNLVYSFQPSTFLSGSSVVIHGNGVLRIENTQTEPPPKYSVQ